MHEYSGLSLDEIGGYFGMKGGAVSQLSKRFKETIKRDKKMQGFLSRVEKDVLSNVET